MLPLYYELGESAARCAIDAHQTMPDADLRADSIIQSAYEIQIEAETDNHAGEDDPEFDWTSMPARAKDLPAENYMEFLQGYFDALKEDKALYELQYRLSAEQSDWANAIAIPLTLKQLNLMLPAVREAFGPDYEFRRTNIDNDRNVVRLGLGS